MKRVRRMLLVLGGAFLSIFSAGTVFAQAYATRGVTFVVPFAAGGATDVLARQFAERMARSSGQPICPTTSALGSRRSQ